MQAADAATINVPFQGDDVVDMHAFWASCVDSKKIGSRYPRRRPVFDVLAAKMKPRGVKGIVSPAVAASSVKVLLALLVTGFLLLSDALSIVGICLVAIGAPLVLVLAVLVYIQVRAGAQVEFGAWPAAVANRLALLVVFGSRFLDAARGTDLGIEGSLTVLCH